MTLGCWSEGRKTGMERATEGGPILLGSQQLGLQRWNPGSMRGCRGRGAGGREKMWCPLGQVQPGWQSHCPGELGVPQPGVTGVA